jgi:hypothetical protein
MIMRSFQLIPSVLGRIAAAVVLLGVPAAPAARAQDAEVLVRSMFGARAWLDAGGSGPAPATPDEVRSAAVVLRLHGRPIGFGKDAGGGSTGDTLERALRAAFAEAREKARARPAAPGDAVGLGRELTIELELAAARAPLIGRTFEEVAKQVEPAACGLQMTDGDRTAYMPSSFLLARHMAAPVSRGIISLVRELELPARDLPELQALGGNTAIYASVALRVAEVRPRGTPMLPCRVLPPVPDDPPARAWAADACSRLTGRLERQLEVAPAGEGLPADAAPQLARTGLRGDYVIVADGYEPFTAGPADQALVAWALSRAAGTAAWPLPVRDRCAATARRVLAALADVDASERDPVTDPAAVACAVLATADLGGADELPAAFAGKVDAALEAALAPAAFAMVRPHARALLLDAAAARAGSAAPPLPRDRLDSEIAKALSEVPAQELPASAPFLFDALRRLNGDGWIDAIDPGQRRSIDAARTVLVATQLRQVTAAGGGATPPVPADAVGAFPATGSPAGRASAQSLRMHLFLATIAGLPGTRSADRDAEDRDALGRANRFLRQLQATAAIAYCAPAPDRAVDGILASPADASQPLAAQAVAILALSESERALGRLDVPAGGKAGIGGSGELP